MTTKDYPVYLNSDGTIRSEHDGYACCPRCGDDNWGCGNSGQSVCLSCYYGEDASMVSTLRCDEGLVLIAVEYGAPLLELYETLGRLLKTEVEPGAAVQKMTTSYLCRSPKCQGQSTKDQCHYLPHLEIQVQDVGYAAENS